MTMVLGMPLATFTFLHVVISLIVLVVSVPFCVWGGAKVFRTGLLMYGKRPSLKQIWRILREA